MYYINVFRKIMILWVFMLLVKSDQCYEYKFCKPKVVGRPRYDETIRQNAHRI